ncbi:helix-turn-helix domain-containing protein [Pseudonocardia acaciae]|uniref:helix-turn-helix domain-containing protein n=1 Tax=Pseudonocardia acaciae TaxID=551276 RepID=UPI0004912484|nr:helix-turn-helix domain-containing protein [Pseudonocardia acaciae]
MNLGEQRVTGDRGSEAGERRLASGSELLTVAEVSTMLRVSKMTIYRMVHSGEIPHVRVGRSFRIPADAVRQILGSRELGQP